MVNKDLVMKVILKFFGFDVIIGVSKQLDMHIFFQVP